MCRNEPLRDVHCVLSAGFSTRTTSPCAVWKTLRVALASCCFVRCCTAQENVLACGPPLTTTSAFLKELTQYGWLHESNFSLDCNGRSELDIGKTYALWSTCTALAMCIAVTAASNSCA